MDKNWHKCDKCGCESTTYDLSQLRFNYLEGSPSICEKCVAAVFGIQADWTPVCKVDIKEKRIA